MDRLHGGSGKQAREGLLWSERDVATLALAADIKTRSTGKGNATLSRRTGKNGLLSDIFSQTSTIVIRLRKGNPKGIKDWNDLIKPGVEVITP